MAGGVDQEQIGKGAIGLLDDCQCHLPTRHLFQFLQRDLKPGVLAAFARAMRPPQGIEERAQERLMEEPSHGGSVKPLPHLAGLGNAAPSPRRGRQNLLAGWKRPGDRHRRCRQQKARQRGQPKAPESLELNSLDHLHQMASSHE